MAVTARISPKSNEIIQEMSEVTGKSKIEIIEAALEAYRHYERMRLFSESYQRLRSNEVEWKAEMEERIIWEKTIADDLEEE